MNELILDHEVKLRDELAGHEEELEMLKAELNHANQEREQILSHLDNQVSLRDQRIEELERYLAETKEALDRQQSAHLSQVEQLAEKLNRERKELCDKIDALTGEITKKERLSTTLENQKDTLL